jgi:dolichol-phosphate mannosyltransferase
MNISEGTDRRHWKITVVVPCLNEASTIGDVIDEVRPFADELLVIDGRSTDGTCDIVRQKGAQLLVDSGNGKGSAIRLGLQAASNPIVVFIDADGSHEAADIPSLAAPIRSDEADIVIGSRMTGGSDELFSDFSEFIRLSGSMVINLAINYRWNIRLSDTQNGYRAVVRDIAGSLGMVSNSTTIEQEMVMKALAAGFRVMNVPSHEYRRKGGESKIIVSRVWAKYVLNVIFHVLKLDRKGKSGRQDRMKRAE